MAICSGDTTIIMPENYLNHLFIEFAALCTILLAGIACWRIFGLVNHRVRNFQPGPTLLALIGIWVISCLGLVARLLGPLNSSLLPWGGLLLLGFSACIVWAKYRNKLPCLLTSSDWRILSLVCLLLVPFNTGEWGWDAGLYHISKGLHFTDTENIAGMALINTRFGFNPLTDIWHALFLSVGAGNFAFYVLNDLLLAVLALFLLELVSKPNGKESFTIVLLFAVLFILARGTVNFTDRGVADFTAMAFTSMAYICLFILVLSSGKTGLVPDSRLRLYVTGSLVVVLACVVKVNSAPVFVFFLIWWLAQCMRGELIRSGMGLFLMATLLSALWLYSNHTISGCWLYPADFTCRSMENAQAVGAGAASYELDIILTHARAPVVDPPLAFLTLGKQPDWYLIWWSANKSLPYTWGMIVGAVGSALLLSIGAFIRRAQFRSELSRYFLLWCCLALHTLYWWSAAPALRYALFLPFMWAVLLAVLIARTINFDLSRTRVASFLPLILLASLFIGVVSSKTMFSSPPNVPEPAFISSSNAVGLLTHTAVPDIRCWDAPLPCSSGYIFDWGDRLDYDPQRGYFLHQPSQ